jgi:nuclear pore complex protein Nup98-Nup96
LTFRLGHALFDTLYDHLDNSIASDVRNRVLTLRRHDELSTWLRHAVSPTVEQELKAHSSGDAAKLAFIHLTGNQLEKAVDALINGGDVRLASLLAQLPGDAEYRYDLNKQLEIWKDEKVDAFISEDLLKLYALAAGEVEVLDCSGNRDVEVSKGLDWLRTFALQLWYGSSLDTTLRLTLEEYEQRYKESRGRVAGPAPWYSKPKIQTSLSVTDGLFSLMKLALVTSTTLESTLVPLSFSPNPRDFSLCWLLYVLLSRSLRLRDFSDRWARDDDSIDGDNNNNGHSLTADVLTTNFASQLEQDGLVQEAAFVLLFLEDDNGRVF